MKARSLMTTIFTLLLCSGCIVKNAVKRTNITEVSPPIEHQLAYSRKISTFDRDITYELSASVGEVMFVLDRYTIGFETLALIPPARLNGFADAATWTITHKYLDRYIYTSPSYYNGQIGFMADNDGLLYKNGSLIQVSGGQAGRSWKLASMSPGHAFYRPVVEREVWGLRYNGKNGETSEFDLINKINPKLSQIVQSLLVSDADLRDGFLVKGVLIRTIGPDEQGKLRYKLQETFSDRELVSAPPTK